MATEQTGIIIRNPHGNEVAYGHYDKIEIHRTDGSTTIYSEGVAVEGMEVTLDCSESSTHTITANDGELIKSANVTITGASAEPIFDLPFANLTFEKSGDDLYYSGDGINYIVEGATYLVSVNGNAAKCKGKVDSETFVKPFQYLGNPYKTEGAEPFSIILNPFTGKMEITSFNYEGENETETVEVAIYLIKGEDNIEIDNAKISLVEMGSFYATEDYRLITRILPGMVYSVTWDGVEYICPATVVESMEVSIIGNKMFFLGEDTGEPFFIMSLEGIGMIYSTVDTEPTTHTISVKLRCHAAPVLNMSETELEFVSANFMGASVMINATPVDIEHIVEGGRYTVIWNDDEYKCTAWKSTITSPAGVKLEIIGIGNTSFATGTASEEPFVIGTVNGAMTIISMSTESTAKASVTLDLSIPDPVLNMESTLLEFDYDDAWRKYIYNGEGITYIVPDAEYLIGFGNKEYSAKATPVEGLEVSAVLGNLSMFGGEDTGEPFTMLVNDYGKLAIWAHADTEAVSRYVSIKLVFNSGKFELEETQLEFSEMDGVMASNIDIAGIIPGAAYDVTWDGVTYRVRTSGVAGGGLTYMGNHVLMIGVNTGEPFIIGVMNNEVMCASIFDTEPTTHTVSISIQTNAESVYNMAETDLIFSNKSGEYTSVMTGVTEIVPDGKYKITFDGTEYDVTVTTFRDEQRGIAYNFIGNLALTNDGEDTGEPFLITDYLLNGNICIIVNEGTSHKVGMQLNFEDGDDNDTDDEKITFYDYDGTVVETWSLTQLQEATSLPANPTHDGLTAQGWNWTLDDLKATNRAMNVGQHYVTSDGKTRLYLNVFDPSYLAMPLILKASVSGGVVIDWGDGSTTTTSGTSSSVYTHTYATTGDYVVTLNVNSGTVTIGHTSNKSGVGSDSSNYRQYLYKVEIGNNTIIGDYAFYNNSSLTTINIPSTITNLTWYAFYSATALKSLCIPIGITSIYPSLCCGCNSMLSVQLPNGVTAINSKGFYQCYYLNITLPDGVTTLDDEALSENYVLEKFTIPDSVTTIGSRMFYKWNALKKITIPASVTTLGDYTFYYCHALKEVNNLSNVMSARMFYYCYNLTTVKVPTNIATIPAYAFYQCYNVTVDFTDFTSIPTLADKYAFARCGGATILVPSVLYDSWISATNWSYFKGLIKAG